MASNYLAADDIERGLELLKQNNICNINSGQIGFIYTVELNKPEEAETYLLSSMSEIINKMIYTVGGMAYAHALKGDAVCITEALWLIHYFDSLKEDADAVTFLDKLIAILLAQCGVWEAAFGHEDKANEYMKSAYLLAEQFDASPIYTVQNIKLLKGMEKDGAFLDGVGKTAIHKIPIFKRSIQGMRLKPATYMGEDIMLFEQAGKYHKTKGIIGCKYEQTDIPDRFISACGNYMVADEMFKDIKCKCQLKVEGEVLILGIEALNVRLNSCLKVVGEDLAILQGFGRLAREMVKLQRREDGYYLTFSGVVFKKI